MTAKILIQGAGIAGLAAAWWLKRRGFAVVVVERAADLRCDGFVLSLGGSGHEVAGRMGILEGLVAKGVELGRTQFRDSQGRDVLLIDHRKHLRQTNLLPVCRDDLVMALHRALDGEVEIRFATQVAALEQDADGIEVRFDDGTQERFAFVVAADGCFSSLRQRYFASDEQCLQSLGYSAAAYTLDGAQARGEERHVSFSEPGFTVELYGMREDLLAALFVWQDQEGLRVPREQRAARLREVFAHAPGDIQRALAVQPEGFYLDHLMQVHLPSWHQGRLVLLGDAAHCLTLASGRGASMALTGAWLLAQELAHSGDVAALQRYEARLRPDIAVLQALAPKMASWYVPLTRTRWHLRNLFMRWTPDWLTGWMLRRTFTQVDGSALSEAVRQDSAWRS
ncbi:NAD(P)-binding protein [Pseudomonas sp. S31]|uniref:FAD-dependent monooxygenase n=1 Tax=Pseudomonas sp. S31 TaxID=1564473 RepID=UPI001913C449|nr:FAD-dependent monooxygenase [Pseudomonas sp. S31]MBK5002835.1 NAD(P)-binding protein [Pseudomonas sp. S31]